MAARIDIAIVENEAAVKNGDFYSAESDQQHIQDTISAFPSCWKQFPEDGVGIKAWLGGPTDTQELAQKIRLQLTSDRYIVNNPTVKFAENGNLIVTPNATI
jgi:hypothetical protein